MPEAIERLAEAVRRKNAILFVGAGVSMSVGLPSWDMLIRHMEEELGIEEESGKSRATAIRRWRNITA